MKIKNDYIKNLTGFTLLEMLVVIGIIGILVTLGFTSYSTVQKSARDAKRKSDLEQVRTALEMYRSNNDAYPIGTWTNLSDLTQPVTYLKSLPTDPKNPTYSYYYNSPAPGSDYTLGAYLETGTANCGVSCTGGNCSYCMGPYGVDDVALPTSTPVPSSTPTPTPACAGSNQSCAVLSCCRPYRCIGGRCR